MTTRSERLLSLDVFRGLTVAGMLLVNNPGTWSSIYPPLEHAPWNGWTPTDLVFPFFLFIVGITTELSLRGRRARGDDESAIVKQVLRRGLLIYLFGFMMSWFPFYSYLPDPELVGASTWQLIVHRIEHVRIMGVLPRIGVAYICGALLTRRTTPRQQAAIIAVLLFGYWGLQTLVPVPGTGVPGRFVLDKPDQLLSAWIDRTVLGLNHLWVGSKTWDPEGLLSTLPAIATMMFGTFAGRWIGRRELSLSDRLAALFAIGALGMMVGMIWNWVFPINKSIWSSSYSVFTAGMAAVCLATCMWVIDVKGWKRWTQPFEVYGLNPMVAFVGSGMMARLFGSMIAFEIEGKRVGLQQVIYDNAYASWLSPINASLAYAICFVLFWYLVLYVLYKRGFVLKV